MWRRKTLLRLLSIQRVLVRHGLDELITATHFLRPLRFLFYLFPRAKDVSDPLGKRIRLALQELGPIFVKFGQAVSTRRDLLPTDVADELAMLQDRVPAFPADQAVTILENIYGKSVDEVFSRFDREPFAAASIAQVHTAALPDGTEFATGPTFTLPRKTTPFVSRIRTRTGFSRVIESLFPIGPPLRQWNVGPGLFTATSRCSLRAPRLAGERRAKCCTAGSTQSDPTRPTSTDASARSTERGQPVCRQMLGTASTSIG